MFHIPTISGNSVHSLMYCPLNWTKRVTAQLAASAAEVCAPGARQLSRATSLGPLWRHRYNGYSPRFQQLPTDMMRTCLPSAFILFVILTSLNLRPCPARMISSFIGWDPWIRSILCGVVLFESAGRRDRVRKCRLLGAAESASVVFAS